MGLSLPTYSNLSDPNSCNHFRIFRSVRTFGFRHQFDRTALSDFKLTMYISSPTCPAAIHYSLRYCKNAASTYCTNNKHRSNKYAVTFGVPPLKYICKCVLISSFIPIVWFYRTTLRYSAEFIVIVEPW